MFFPGGCGSWPVFPPFVAPRGQPISGGSNTVTADRMRRPPQLLALGARQTVLATLFIAVRLTHPVAHRLRRALELASQLPGRATCPHQSDAHTIWRRYSGA